MTIDIAKCKAEGNVRNYVNGELVGPKGAPLFVGPPHSSFKNPLPERKFAGLMFKLIGTDAATNCAVYEEMKAGKPKKAAKKTK